MSPHTICKLIILILGVNTEIAWGQGAKDSNFNNPEDLVRHLYDEVTFPPGELPDWDVVRSMFVPQSTIHMRTGKEKTSTFTLENWIDDFVKFIEERKVIETGFNEKILKLESMVFGDIAHILVLYAASIPGITETPREGVDSFHLTRKEDSWKIVSILNEIPSETRPMPNVLN